MDEEDALHGDTARFVMAVRNTFVEVSSRQVKDYSEGVGFAEPSGMRTAPASLNRSLPRSKSADFIYTDVWGGSDEPQTPSTPTTIAELWPPTPVTPGAPFAISLAELTEDPWGSGDDAMQTWADSPPLAANMYCGLGAPASMWLPPVQPPNFPPSLSQQVTEMGMPAPYWVATPLCR